MTSITKNIVVIGASGHAKVAADIFSHHSDIRIIGLIDGSREKYSEVNNFKILGCEDEIPHLVEPRNLYGYFVAIGDNHVRRSVVSRIKKSSPELVYCSAVHPTAVISGTAVIGDGILAAALSNIGPDCVVREGCIVNTKASLDHDSEMEDYASLAPGATTGGGCKINEGSAIGIGATLRDNVTIGQHSVIGAGSLVMKNVEPFTVAYGVPAQCIRSRVASDRYL